MSTARTALIFTLAFFIESYASITFTTLHNGIADPGHLSFYAAYQQPELFSSCYTTKPILDDNITGGIYVGVPQLTLGMKFNTSGIALGSKLRFLDRKYYSLNTSLEVGYESRNPFSVSKEINCTSSLLFSAWPIPGIRSVNATVTAKCILFRELEAQRTRALAGATLTAYWKLGRQYVPTNLFLIGEYGAFFGSYRVDYVAIGAGFNVYGFVGY